MQPREEVQELHTKYKQMIKDKGGVDITCLSDKEIVSTAFRFLKHKIYDEIVAEGIIRQLEAEVEKFDV